MNQWNMWHQMDIQCQKTLQKNTGTSRVGPPYTHFPSWKLGAMFQDYRPYILHSNSLLIFICNAGTQNIRLSKPLSLPKPERHSTTGRPATLKTKHSRTWYKYLQSNCKMVMQEKYWSSAPSWKAHVRAAHFQLDLCLGCSISGTLC